MFFLDIYVNVVFFNEGFLRFNEPNDVHERQGKVFFCLKLFWFIEFSKNIPNLVMIDEWKSKMKMIEFISRETKEKSSLYHDVNYTNHHQILRITVNNSL